jgi:hypothetical protein
MRDDMEPVVRSFDSTLQPKDSIYSISVLKGLFHDMKMTS